MSFTEMPGSLTTTQTQGVTAVPLLSLEERHRLLVEWNDTAAEYPQERCIHQLFEEQVVRDPQAVAVVFEDVTLSYGELSARANQLAHHLLSLGIRPDDRVAICVERSLEMVLGVLGILKAGAAYVPLDPAYPADRLAYMLDDSAPVVVLSHAPARAALAAAMAGLGAPPPVIDLEAGVAQWVHLPAEPLDPAALGLTSRHLAYVIYTSGSTGRPKGVMIEHRGLVAVRLAYQRPYGLRAGLTHLQMASIAFDVFTADLIRSLTFGGKLVICPRHSMLDPIALYEALRRHAVNIAEFVPVALAQLMSHLERTGGDLSFMEVVVCSSDQWAAEDGRRLRRLCRAGVRTLNSYGATEATIDSTYFDFEESLIIGATTVPIGRPMLNTRVYILDAMMEPVPQGVVGELWIGGAGLARGYLNRPELTAERFVTNPFVAGDRLYKTGDLVRYLPDGKLEFLGRNDFQVKIRGFRIELGEIEARLTQYAQVLQAVVLAREDTSGDKRLVGYYTAAAQIRVEVLRAHLSAVLPEYMVPAAFVWLEAMPVTPNGKLDRKALPAPGDAAYVLRTYQAPEGPVETALADIWSKILTVERIGRHDHFFQLGGNSLTAIQISTRIREHFKINLPLRLLLQDATVASLGEKLEEARAAANAHSKPSRAKTCERPE